MRKRVILGLSGGVDSSTAASLLTEQGFEVIGVYLRMRDCEKTESDMAAAKSLCEALGIEFHVRDAVEDFEKHVVSSFCAAYLSGRTPNPCVMCNEQVKIASLIRFADENGVHDVATGHYASVSLLPGGRYSVSAAKSSEKDQSYFLCRLSQDALCRLVFPLGSAPDKAWTRELARKAGISGTAGDSQDICFIGHDESYGDFVLSHTGETAACGDFLSTDGEVIGRHRGLVYYTVGQRKGLGAFGKKMFVTSIDSEKNAVILGDQAECMKNAFRITDTVFSGADESTRELSGYVKIYSRSRLFPCTARFSDGGGEITVSEPCRAAAGQSAVIYDGDGHVLACGTIE